MGLKELHRWRRRRRITLQWHHNECNGVSNHQPHDCLPNRLFRRRSKKTSKLRVTGLCAGNALVNSPHKWPVTRKMFAFDHVIMIWPITDGYPITATERLNYNRDGRYQSTYWYCYINAKSYITNDAEIQILPIDDQSQTKCVLRTPTNDQNWITTEYPYYDFH